MPRAKKSSRKRTRASKTAVQSKTAIVAKGTASFPIVAIGASAGGFEAFINLLRTLPKDPGLALIFIPHLDPTHESAMVDLLARATVTILRLPCLSA